MSALEIPQSACAAMLNEQDDYYSDAEVDEAIRRIAGPVVAAELRRLADDLNGTHAQPEMNAGLSLAIRQLRARAAELDAGVR